MAITINNATDFDIEKMTSFNCDKHIEVVTTASLAPTDTHRFIYDIYHNSVLLGRFKAAGYAFPDGAFNIARIARSAFIQRAINDLSPYVQLKTIGFTEMYIQLDIEVGEEINNVDTINLASYSCYLFNGFINYKKMNFAKLGQIEDAATATNTKFFLLPNRRHLYHSDTSKTLIPYSAWQNLGTAPTNNLTIQRLDDDMNVVSAIAAGANDFRIREFYAYYGSGGRNSGLTSLLYGTSYRMTESFIGSDTLDVKYICEPFTELYFLNSWGAFEQFIFTFEKEKTQVTRSNYATRDKIYSPDVTGNVIYDKAYHLNRQVTLSVAKMLDSNNEYLSFVEMINSKICYLVRDNEFVPCEIVTNSTDGYVARYDKAKEITAEIKYIWR